MPQQTLKVSGMRCAGCVSAIEKQLTQLPEVTRAEVNLATEEARIELSEATGPERLVEAVQRAGYTAEPAAEHHHLGDHHVTSDGGPTPESRAWLWRLATMLALAAGVLVLAMTWDTRASAWLQLALATPVQLVLGWPFYQGAWRALKHFTADMDSLVALGTSVAFGYSAVITVTGGSTVYFDTAVVILVLIGLGKWMEARARSSAAAAIRELMALQPDEATVLRDGEEVTVPVREVSPGQRLVVRPGGRVPVDGQVLEGLSTLDKSMVTGESVPVEVSEGDEVFAGTINQTGRVIIRARATGADMLLSQVIDLVKRAQASKAQVQRLVDRVASVFVPVVLVIALLALIGWSAATGDGVLAMQICVAVLIVACPCALGLATPTAIMVGTGIGARRGILIKDAAALERAGRLWRVVLDKTGTLTYGEPSVTDLQALDGGQSAGLLRWAGAVETGSEHPLGRAIVRAARNSGIELEPATNFQSITGGGVMADVAGARVIVGQPETLREQGVALDGRLSSRLEPLQQQGKTAVAVAVDGQWQGLIALADRIRPEAADVVDDLKDLGLTPVLLTGDNHRTAVAVAGELSIEDVLAEVKPTDKQQQIARLQEQGHQVAMVGDGINDAPALAAADLGLAVGGGTDIAKEAGHIVLVSSELSLLPAAIRLSRDTMRRIYLGLFWAFIYNIILIPVAVAGYLHPMFAAAAMAASSVSVVGNALLLRWQYRRHSPRSRLDYPPGDARRSPAQAV